MPKKRARLVALIEHMDHGVGRVLEALRQSGLEDDTLVVFTSDNGGQLGVGADNGALRGGKQDLYEGGLRVPQAAVWPGRIQPGSSTDVATLSMDLFTTCCAVAGAAEPNDVDGVSILPTLLGSEQLLERDLFWTRKEGNLRYLGQSVWAVRSGGWKLLQNNPQQPFELYHLAHDPLEERDVREQQPKVYRELAAKLRAHMQRGGAVPWQPPERAGRR
jgi:arylsulfatase A-like enzyme